MEFINEKEDDQVRQEEPVSDKAGPAGFNWKKVKKGEKIDLPRKVGIRHGFTPAITKGKIGKKEVETKQFESEDYKKELINIKGISRKRAEDILIVFPTKEDLIKSIRGGQKLPFRDDIEKKLRGKYGNK